MVLKIKSIIIITFLAIGLVGCESDEDNKVSLRQEWFPYAGYAGELMGIENAEGIEITLEEGSDNVDPVKMVTSGTNDFGVASADRILTANEKGAELVVIGVINHNSPTCFLTKKESGILSPNDFKGKRVGILAGTNTEYIYKALKIKLNLDESQIDESDIPFDLATFIAGQYDVRPAFVYDETVSLDQQGIEYNIIEPKDYGIQFLGTVYFTRKETVEDHPELVQSFVNAMAIGWEKTIENPDKAIELLKEYDPSIDSQRELASLKKGLNYFKGQDGKVLYSDMESWKAMAETLIDLKVIKAYNLDESVDMQFVNQYHSK